MASVYILYSFSAGKYYVGSTKNLEQRVEYHLTKEFPKSYTVKYSDWELYYEISELSIRVAKQIKNHIKK